MNLLKVTHGKSARYYNLDAVVWFEYEIEAPRARGALAALSRSGKSSAAMQPRIRIQFQGTTVSVTVSGAEAERIYAALCGPQSPPTAR